MRQETHTANIYNFIELSESAKQKAVKDEIESRLQDENYNEMLKEILTKKLENEDFTDCKLEYSLSYSQGDGVAFYGKIDASEFIEEYKEVLNRQGLAKWKINGIIAFLDGCTIDISKNHWGNRYTHQNCMDIDVYSNERYFWDYIQLQKQVNIFTAWMLQKVKTLSIQLEELGYSFLDDLTDTETVAEYLSESDYEFLEDGSLYY